MVGSCNMKCPGLIVGLAFLFLAQSTEAFSPSGRPIARYGTDMHTCSAYRTCPQSLQRQGLSRGKGHFQALGSSISADADGGLLGQGDEALSTSAEKATTATTTTTTATTTTTTPTNGDMEATTTSVAKLPFWKVLWRFSRPHTLIGSALSIPALHALAAPSVQQLFSRPTLASILFAMLPSLLMNLYITGLNQITDVDIDKINKPDLPIAAGDLSVGNAKVIVLLALAASLAMGVSHPILGTSGLNWTLWGSAILGTMYSLPPIRLKRHPLMAALCIVAVRGTIINAGFFAHATAAAYSTTAAARNSAAAVTVLTCLRNNRRCALSSLFFGVFGIVIALMKDVPDVAGDEQSNIRSFSVRAGQVRIFHTMRRLLMLLFASVGTGFVYQAAKAVPISIGLAVSRMGVGTASFAAIQSVRHQAKDVNPKDSAQVYKYYMHLWKIFYLCYLALPFAR
jgi:homogentisate phytyltransferase/homogentisate geranylgeranyltransferase